MITIKLKGNPIKEIEAAVNAKKKSIISTLVKDLKEATPVDTGEARDGWRVEGNAIVNDVEHISYLNQGTSTQAPAYFIEKTLLTHEGVRPSGTIVRPK